MLYLQSIHDEVGAMAHPERIERRLRTIAALGGRLPSGALAWANRRRAAYGARLNEPFAEHDVLLTPVTPSPPPDRRMRGARLGANGIGILGGRAVCRLLEHTPASPPARCPPVCGERVATRGAADRTPQ